MLTRHQHTVPESITQDILHRKHTHMFVRRWHIGHSGRESRNIRNRTHLTCERIIAHAISAIHSHRWVTTEERRIMHIVGHVAMAHVIRLLSRRHLFGLLW